MSEDLLDEDGDLRKTGQAYKQKRTPSWKPETEGDYVQGIVQEYKEVDIDGDKRTVLNLETTDGCISVWPNNVLEDQLIGMRVGVGDLIGVEYNGMKKGSNKRMYKRFTLYVK
jgi:hypothetical protein